MLIHAFSKGDLTRLVDFYNKQALSVPYTPRLTEEIFSHRVLRHPLFSPADLLIGVTAGKITGFVHTGLWPRPKTVSPHIAWLGPYWEFGTIVNLQFTKNTPGAGDCLIRAAEERIRVRKRHKFAAFSRLGGYLFYKDLYLAGEPLCWDGSAHIQDALIRAGYHKTEPTRLMGMRLNERPTEKSAAIKIDIMTKKIPPCRRPEFFLGFAGKPGRIVLAYHKGEFAGSCGFALLEESVTDSHGRSIAAFGMGTMEKFKRKGVGTQVLTHALGLMWDEGIRKVVLQTGDDNLPAVRLYEKLGFKTESASHAHGFRKDAGNVHQVCLKEDLFGR